MVRKHSLAVKDLPLIEFTKNLHLDTDLTGTYLIAQQHIVPTILPMIQAFFDLGLKPSNFSVIGKCYSTDIVTFLQLKLMGIHVCESSYVFKSHLSFDSQYKQNLKRFLTQIMIKLKKDKFRKIIILDDGGDLVIESYQFIDRKMNIVGIEQTSSGFTKILREGLKFPVINLARSEAKLKYESPIVAELSMNRLFTKVNAKKIKKVLIIGAGSIGSRIFDILKVKYDVAIYDKDQSKSMLSSSQFEQSLSQYDLIIGCSGEQVFKTKHFSLLSQNVILASDSSSDREFNAVCLRRKFGKIENCHQDIEVEGIRLLNCGFPIIFDSNYDAADQTLLDRLQLTRSLILSSVCQANAEPRNRPEFILLDKTTQKTIIDKYLSIYPNKRSPVLVHNLKYGGLQEKRLAK